MGRNAPHAIRGCSAAAAAAYPVPRLYLYEKWDSARCPTLATD